MLARLGRKEATLSPPSLDSESVFHPNFHVDSSLMCTWLLGDANTPSIVLKFLPLIDIARLHASCALWKNYVANPKTVYKASMSPFDISPTQLNYSSVSTWLRQRTSSLRVNYTKDIAHKRGDWLQTYALEAVPRHTSILSTFTHLCHLDLHIVEDFLSAQLFEACGRLTMLQCLRIYAISGSWLLGNEKVQLVANLSLAPLRNCSLTTFCLQIRGSYHFTQQQLTDLIACQSLTSLDCAQWCKLEYYNFNDSHEWVAENLDLLSNLRSLRKINLLKCDVSKVDWMHLSKISTLTSLTPEIWSPSIREQWSSLRNFTSLTELHYQSKQSQIKPVCTHFWNALLQVPTITELKLRGIAVTNDQWLALFRSLRQLRRLRLLFTRLESCDAFSEASTSLQELSFCRCSDLEGKVIYYHVSLPIIKELRRLLIVENAQNNDWADDEVPCEETKSLFKSMLATRMSKLTIDRIVYEIKD